VRTSLEPGDIGEIVRLHGTLYAEEYGLDRRFEAEVAQNLGKAVRGGFPREGEGVWLEEREGRLLGGIFLIRQSARIGRVRWFILTPEARGQGLGRRLLAELMQAARAYGYEHMWLETFSALEAAAHLYREAGFELRGSEESTRWGPEIVVQSYEARLGSSSTTAEASVS